MLSHFGPRLSSTLAQSLQTVLIKPPLLLLSGLLHQILESATEALVCIRNAVTEAAGEIDRPLICRNGISQALLGVVFQVEPVTRETR